MKVTFPPGFEEEERPDYDYDPELPVYGYEPGPPAAGSGSGAGHVVSEDNATKCTHDYASYAQMDWQKECQMSGGWTRLMPDARAGLLKTGGMGLQATTHAHTWVCHYSHRCASRFNSSQLTSGRKCDFSRRGRCGPQFNNITCGGGGAEPIPSWAVYCNEENGWCGITDAHRNAQASTAYDFEADSGGYCDGEDTNAVTAYSVRECLDECREAGYSSLLGTQFPDVFSGCCNKLSCAQACMSRVNGLSVHACQDLVHSVAAGNDCRVEVDGRGYHVCDLWNSNASACQVEPTVESALFGCRIGGKPLVGTMDPFCWIYDEREGCFVPFGPGSSVGLA